MYGLTFVATELTYMYQLLERLDHAPLLPEDQPVLEDTTYMTVVEQAQQHIIPPSHYAAAVDALAATSHRAVPAVLRDTDTYQWFEERLAHEIRSVRERWSEFAHMPAFYERWTVAIDTVQDRLYGYQPFDELPVPPKVS